MADEDADFQRRVGDLLLRVSSREDRSFLRHAVDHILRNARTMNLGDCGSYRVAGDAKKMEALVTLHNLGPIAVLREQNGRMGYELFSILQLEYLAKKLGL